MTISIQRLTMSRRTFVRAVGGGVVGFTVFSRGLDGTPRAIAAILGGTLDPGDVEKYVDPLLIPPVMPKAARLPRQGGKNVDYYEISMRQFDQQILPSGWPTTTVWGYGPVSALSKKAVMIHNAPSLTIETTRERPLRVKWINDLVDENGDFLPHLLPVDQTLHWANPPGGNEGRDTRPSHGSTPGTYDGPVPIITHVHGSLHVGDESDGYTEAWWLPAANDIPDSYATEGTWYDFFRNKAETKFGVTWGPGYAVFQYPNFDRARTNWYHDHALGMTRLNVYAGPAGFYIVRGGAGDAVLDSRTGEPASLPGPAPKDGDGFPSKKRYREIPIVIQDRAFNEDGSLFYPDSRTFFDGIAGEYIPDGDFPPIWNPEFFGNTMMVNGRTWPYLTVEQRRYRFRFLNGCQSRFLILDFANIIDAEVWQVGNDGGFLSSPVDLRDTAGRLLLGLAERADVIVDFTAVPLGEYELGNLGPDEPFGGGVPGDDGDEGEEGFEPADPATTGKVMQFRVVPAVDADTSTPPGFLTLPPVPAPPPTTTIRRLALIEIMGEGSNGTEGPVEALLGVVNEDMYAEHRLWSEVVTEAVATGATEVWEIYNTTGDAHPIHLHEVAFEVVNRQDLVSDGDEVVQPLAIDGSPRIPDPGESGLKDTVTAYPAQVTRIRATFETPGQYVWHCHILEHEDNEMMRPLRVGPAQDGAPGN